MRRARVLWFAVGGVAAAILVVAGAKFGPLVVVTEPRSAPHLAFDGFIQLPGHNYLNILDYLTLDGRALYVTSESAGSVYKVDLSKTDRSGGPSVTELPGKPSAHGVAIVDSVKLAFVSRSDANTVDAFSPDSLTKTASIPVEGDADAILYDRLANLVYVAHGDPKSATLIDPDKRKVVGGINLGGKPEFPVLDQQSGLIYQNLNDTNQVVAVDVAARSVVGRWSLAPCDGPSSLAIDLANRVLFAVCNRNARFVAFSLDQHKVLANLPVGGGPDSVAFDPANHHIYVAGKAGELTMIQQDRVDSYRVLATIHTHFGAHTLAVDPITHKVYVAYASLLLAPRLAVFTPR